MVNTAAGAARFLKCLRYPPLGEYSFGPTRVSLAAGTNYAGEANDTMLGFAMIETAKGFANVESIAVTPGLDGLDTGPADLALTQGRPPPGLDREQLEMIAATQTILAAAKKTGIRAGIHCGAPEYAAKAIGLGFDLTTKGGDSRFLATAAGSAVAGFRRPATVRASMREKGAH